MRYWAGLIIITLFSTSSHAYQVYKCKDKDGNTVFSQTRCVDSVSTRVNVDPASGEDDPYRRSQSLTERANKGKYSKSSNNKSKSKNSKSKNGKSNSSNQAKDSSSCKYAQDRVANVQSKMKGGYSSDQGERLRSQLRSAKANASKQCK